MIMKIREKVVLNKNIKSMPVFKPRINGYSTNLPNVYAQRTFSSTKPDSFERQNMQITFGGAGILQKFVKFQNPKRLATKTVEKFCLDYDPIKPLFNTLKENEYYDFILPEKFIPTNNRADMKELVVPEFIKNGKVEFQLPMTKDVKISKAKNISFEPMQNKETNWSENYADSINWSYDKIARDILQNFYDGHGQTLDGVKFEITPTPKGNYNVKILGKSTYTPDKAILAGETDKRNNICAAGNYGEGIKMSALKILKDSHTKEIKLSSQNWQVSYSLQNSKLNNKKVLGYSLNKTEEIDGNHLEFETNDKILINSLKKAINYFYHSGNTDFKCPDFENSFFGIKKLDENQDGSIYIAGQRFEFNNEWQGLKGFTIFFKEKPPTNVLDISRDRLSINKENLSFVLKYFSEKSSPKERIEVLHSMQDFWTLQTNDCINNERNTIANEIVYGLLKAIPGYTKIKFPDDYICEEAWGYPTALLNDLKSKGYKICNNNFKYTGMQTIQNFIQKASVHEPLQPTEIEIQKIGIIKKALAQFSQLNKSGLFSLGELNPKIYIFDTTSKSELKLNENTRAEAIVDYKTQKSIGFWIDRKYFQKESIYNILGTALHEITHKAGGDGDEKFSYALTDVLKKIIETFLSKPEAYAKLKKLESEWDLINK